MVLNEVLICFQERIESNPQDLAEELLLFYVSRKFFLELIWYITTLLKLILRMIG